MVLMAFEKASSVIPSQEGFLRVIQPEVAPQAIPVSPSDLFQGLEPMLKAHLFSFIPVGALFRSMLVSTHWRTLLISLPDRHNKFKLLVGILKEAKALLQKVSDASHYYFRFLRLEMLVDKVQAQQTVCTKVPILDAVSTPGGALAYHRQLLSIVFELDPALVHSSDLTDFKELIWVLQQKEAPKRDAILQREVRLALSFSHPHQLLGVLEVARELLDPEVVKELLHRAKEETLHIFDPSSRKHHLLRAVELSLVLDSDQVTFAETKAFLARESDLEWQALGRLRVAKRELKQNLHQPEQCKKIVQMTLTEILPHLKTHQVEIIEMMASFDWKMALESMPIVHNPLEAQIALEAIFLKVAREDFAAFTSGIPAASAKRITQFLGWLAIAKRELELALPSAQASLQKALLLQEGAPKQSHDFMFHRISGVEAYFSIESSLATAKKIEDQHLRLDALLNLAQLIAE